jgi:hypothetical protein
MVALPGPVEVEEDDGVEEDVEAEGDSEVGDELQLIANAVARNATADDPTERSRLNMGSPPVADEQVMYPQDVSLKSDTRGRQSFV